MLKDTRWHEDDLSGRLLQAQPGQWRVVSLPAEAEEGDPLGRAPGEMLWGDDHYGYAASLTRVKVEASTRSWSALYQERPVSGTGDRFLAEWLHPTDSLPERATLRVYDGSDDAVTSGGGDWTVHVVLGMDPNSRLWLLDLWRGQAAADAWIEAFCDLVRRWHPIGWAEETGKIRAGVGPFLERRMRERQAYVARHPFPSRGDKAVRAQSIRGRMALDGLYVPKSAPWRLAFEAELLSFPAGRHDDQVDTLGLVGQLLDRVVKDSALKPKPDEQEDRYAKLFANDDEEGVTSWKTV
ncbi:hypothetical protein [Muricoccus aerilatus]|uniref:hypothetical protein n=1 Tax=Muricoccus aerilatus TaxID=452982 RepID=UPI0012ECB843|nr:hypothetical protein [Roseomonas aerilata]